MYDTRLVDTALSLDGVLSHVTEYDIYRYYTGTSFKIGHIMSSPFRQDKNPSFGIFKSSKSGQLLYKDQATGDSGNCIQFVQKLYNISYREAVVKILSDLVTGSLHITTKGIEIKEDYHSANKIVSVKRKNFSDVDDKYWGQYCLNRDDLRHFNVFPISEYWINEIVQPWGYKEANPGYAYQIYNKYKLLFPYNDKKYKWISNCSNYDIQGYEQLPYKGDLVIITKSLKDVMVLHKLGYNAIAPQGENHSIPKEVMQDLEKRYDRIVLFYDNDAAGIAGASKIANKYTKQSIFIPDNSIKDISDYVKEHGLEEAKQLMIKLLDNEKI